MFYFHMRNVPIGLRSCIIRASNLFIVLVGHFFGGLKHDARLQNRSSICTMPGRKFFQPEWGGGNAIGNRTENFGAVNLCCSGKRYLPYTLWCFGAPS